MDDNIASSFRTTGDDQRANPAVGVCHRVAVRPGRWMLLTPIVTRAAGLLFLVERYWRRDRHPPILDVGTLCVFITLVYAAVPALLFIKAGFKWSDLSDPRLLQMSVQPADVAALLWRVTAKPARATGVVDAQIRSCWPGSLRWESVSAIPTAASSR